MKINNIGLIDKSSYDFIIGNGENNILLKNIKPL